MISSRRVPFKKGEVWMNGSTEIERGSNWYKMATNSHTVRKWNNLQPNRCNLGAQNLGCGNFSQMIDPEMTNVNPLLRRSISGCPWNRYCRKWRWREKKHFWHTKRWEYSDNNWVRFDKWFQLFATIWTYWVKLINWNYFCSPSDYN